MPSKGFEGGGAVGVGGAGLLGGKKPKRTWTRQLRTRYNTYLKSRGDKTTISRDKWYDIHA